MRQLRRNYAAHRTTGDAAWNATLHTGVYVCASSLMICDVFGDDLGLP